MDQSQPASHKTQTPGGIGSELGADLGADPKAERQLSAIKALIAELRERLDLNAAVRLWDGSSAALGANVTSGLAIAIDGPGTIGTLLRCHAGQRSTTSSGITWN